MVLLWSDQGLPATPHSIIETNLLFVTQRHGRGFGVASITFRSLRVSRGDVNSGVSKGRKDGGFLENEEGTAEGKLAGKERLCDAQFVATPSYRSGF